MSKNFVDYSNAEDLFEGIQDALEPRKKTWQGTEAEWEALTTEQKIQYERADITDDDASGDVDSVPTENSPNLVTSGGVYSALSTKANSADLGTAAGKDYTTNVSPNNHSLVESNAVYSAINNALSSVYTPRGSITCAELVSSLLIPANVGNVYNTTDSGTTTADFMQGAGVTINAGDSVGIIQTGPSTYKFNLMGNTIDLHEYQKKDLAQAVEGETTVEGALGALSSNKQAKTLTTSVEGETTVEGALGALSTNKATQAEVNDIVNVLGAKNLLPNTAVTQTVNGITFTVNADGSVTANGTASSNARLIIASATAMANACADADVILSGCPSGGSEYKYQIYTRTSAGYLHEYGDSIVITQGTSFIEELSILVSSGQTVSNIVFKPMIRLASDPDNTYVPYAKSNQQLTQDVNGLEENLLQNGAVNVLPFSLTDIKANNANASWSGNVCTYNGVTYTFDEATQSITIDGTATGNRSVLQFYVGTATKLFKKGFRYRARTFNTYFDGTNDAFIQVYKTNSPYTRIDMFTGNSFVVPNDLMNETITVQIVVPQETTVSNQTIKLMIASDNFTGDYVPYAKSNRELTEKIDIVGNLFTTTTKVVDNITHGIATTIATLRNLPIGTYVVSGQFNSDSAMSGGGLIQFASSGVIQNGASCNTMINQGFKANAGLTGIFNVTNATNQINLQIYTANADLTVSSVKLAAIRIA